MTIHWWSPATLALLNMPRADAEAVDAAVQRWATTGEGIVHSVEGGTFLLYVDAGAGGTYVVELTIDLDADAMHVARVRRP